MNEREVMKLLTKLLEEHDEKIEVDTFANAGLLTMDKGLVVSFPDKTEYLLTVRRY